MGKRAKAPEKAANHERWLVSFADFMTLLFALFVVLFANSKQDIERMGALSVGINQAFSSLGLWPGGGSSMQPTDPNAAPPYIMIDVRDPGKAFPQMSPEESDDFFPAPPPPAPETEWDETAGPQTGEVREGIGAAGSPELKKVLSDLRDILQMELNTGTIDLHEERRGITITLGEAGFFDSGSAALKMSSIAVLDPLAAKLRTMMKTRKVMIRIEGHTDNIPLSFNARFRDNYELSTARANSVVRRLVTFHGFPPQNVSASGYGEFRPVASNDTPDGRARNRRVDIVLLSDEFAAMEPSSAP